MSNTKQMTISEIAVATGQENGKQIRAYLRKNHSRSSEQKNSRWGDARRGYVLSAKLTSELLERFTPADAE